MVKKYKTKKGQSMSIDWRNKTNNNGREWLENDMPSSMMYRWRGKGSKHLNESIINKNA